MVLEIERLCVFPFDRNVIMWKWLTSEKPHGIMRRAFHALNTVNRKQSDD